MQDWWRADLVAVINVKDASVGAPGVKVDFSVNGQAFSETTKILPSLIAGDAMIISDSPPSPSFTLLKISAFSRPTLMMYTTPLSVPT